VNRHWRNALLTPALAAGLGLVLWPMVGPVWAALAAAALVALLLALLLAHQLANLSQLEQWLRDPRPEALPVGSGRWEQVFSYLSRLLRRQSQTEGRLMERIQRFEAAGAAMPETVVVLDEDNRIQWCNPKAAQYLGLDPARDVGQQVGYLVRQPSFVDYLQRADFSQPLLLRLTPPGLGEVSLSVQFVPYGESEKLLLGRDVTRWEKLETTRRDFVANVSHELRTPLTVLNGFLETLIDLRRPDPEMTRRSLELMSQQNTRMNRLVEDLLTLSRLESTHSPARDEPVDVPDLCEHLLQDALALSGGRHEIRLHSELRDGLHGSQDELRSAFGNLVSNAIRYTPPGGLIELRWWLRGSEPVFSVSDTGIGIETQHIERLTERFYRVDRSRSRETGGTGLGLAIVKHVLQRHQAHLEVESEPGKGSTFSAVFPADRTQPLAQPQALAAAS
jgi:two-component system phosphate regulon sensor histidine kinase PhoR